MGQNFLSEQVVAGQLPLQIWSESDTGEVFAFALFDARLILHTHVVLKYLCVMLLVFRIVRLNGEFPIY